MYHIGDFKMEIVLAEHKYKTVNLALLNPEGKDLSEDYVFGIVNEYDKQKDGSYLLTDSKARAVAKWCYEWVYCTVDDNDGKTLYSHGWRLETEGITIYRAAFGKVGFVFNGGSGIIEIL